LEDFVVRTEPWSFDMTAATATRPLTQVEIQNLATAWYQKLDVHAPLVELLPLVAEEGLEMVFPEGTLRSRQEFEGWYERVIGLFFDEVHAVKQVKSTITEGGAEVKVVVHWEASVWKAPAARSQRIKLDAYQTWRVVRDAKTDRPVILRYTVDELKYDADSAKL
jgi:hypothetical protein